MGHGPLVKSISLYYLISIVKDGCGNFGVKCVDNISLSLSSICYPFEDGESPILILHFEREGERANGRETSCGGPSKRFTSPA